jgi:hypothetical protein|tara:strand:- start:983 stop:1582 length:600 start_codon:yes stop_codon:yes gene_type:complete
MTITVNVSRPNLQVSQFKIKGLSPLISHKWSEKAKKEMLDKQMKKKLTAKQAKNPEAEFESSLYLLSNGTHPKGPYGFPAIAFKAAAVRAAKQVDGMAMTDARSLFYVEPDDGDLVQIYSPKPPEMREDMVRLNGKSADIRYRGSFINWSVILNVRYNADVVSQEQLLNLFELAGFSCGIGEWRMEKGGTFGTFTLLDN